VLASFVFLTPLGGLLAFLVIAPLAALVVSSRKARRGRTVLGLAPPKPASRLTIALLACVPLLLGLAAAEPAWRTHTAQRVRTDAQAMFVFDISRSMLASTAPGAQTRLEQARNWAISFRNSEIPNVPSGVSTFTTLLIPHLFPTPNAAVFNSTVRNTVDIEEPPPPYLAPGFPGTSFSALAPLRDQGYFATRTQKRFVILLTDGESGPYSPSSLGETLTGPDYVNSNLGEPSASPQPPLTLLIVRFGAVTDRIYHRNGSVEAAYRPDPAAPEVVATLADNTGAHVFVSSQLAAAGAELRRLLGSGPSTTFGEETKTLQLAPYAVLVALLALAGVILRRNLSSI
jgi:hypothetical protein